MPISQIDATVVDVKEQIDVKEVVDVGETLNQKGKALDKEADYVELLADEMETALAISEDEPSIREALSGDERVAWMDAIEVELTQMEKVKAWAPVIPPPDANIIPSLFVFCRKCNETGKIVRYKARLVIKGFRQKFGIDYVDTFSPTICPPTLHILLSFAAQK